MLATASGTHECRRHWIPYQWRRSHPSLWLPQLQAAQLPPLQRQRSTQTKGNKQLLLLQALRSDMCSSFKRAAAHSQTRQLAARWRVPSRQKAGDQCTRIQLPFDAFWNTDVTMFMFWAVVQQKLSIDQIADTVVPKQMHGAALVR